MTIETYTQLEEFLSLKIKNTISIRLEHLTESENKRTEVKLNSLINECGCKTGGFFLVAGILIYFGALFIFSFSLSHHFLFITALVLFSLLGKLIGIRVAKYKLKKEVSKILSKVKQKASLYAALS